MKLGFISIWREKPGVISDGHCWCAAYGCWLHTADSLPSLLWNVIMEWKHDRHICG